MKFSFVEETYIYWDNFDYFMDFCFAIDIVLTFFTCTYDENEDLIVSWKIIACSYIKFWFWIDAISVLPIQFIFETGNMKVLLRASKLPKLYKITKITRLVRTAKAGKKQNSDTFFSRMYDVIRLNPGIDRIASNLFSIFIFCHIIACLCHFIAWTSEGQNNWIYAKGLEDASAFDRYLTSLYWISQTVITVGYGDIPISNAIEMVIAILAMFAGVIFFSITVGSLTTIIGEMDKRRLLFERKLNTLAEIKSHKKISGKTYNKLRDIIKYGIYRAEEDYREFLEKLPDSVKVDISYKIYHSLVKGIVFFKNAEKHFIAELGPFLKKISYMKNEVIFSEGEHAYEFYFIKGGGVGYVIQDLDNTPFMLIGKGNYFGEIDMLFQQHRMFTAIALSDVDLLVLSAEKYRELIANVYQQLHHDLREQAIARRVRQIALYDEVRREVVNILEIVDDSKSNAPSPRSSTAGMTLAFKL